PRRNLGQRPRPGGAARTLAPRLLPNGPVPSRTKAIAFLLVTAAAAACGPSGGTTLAPRGDGAAPGDAAPAQARAIATDAGAPEAVSDGSATTDAGALTVAPGLT